ncbi:MAG: prepilin peptidase [Butyrivibrio sp.]|nr:prepilin peptidase [Butyrivibrio sp.]
MRAFLDLITINYIQTAMAIVITVVMAILAYTDYRDRRIPNRVLGIAGFMWLLIMVIALLTCGNEARGLMVKCAGGALIAGGAFLLCYIIVRGKLGAGDVKMAALMGLYLGSDLVAGALIAGIIISAVYSVIMILAKRLTVKDGLPMAPFLFLGTIIALLYTIV